MALFGLLGKKKEREEERLGLKPEEVGLGTEKLGFGEEEELVGTGIAPREEAPAGMSPFPGVQQVQAPPPTLFKDIELLSAKLDAIRALLENINTRLANLERIARGEAEHYERY